MTKRIVERTQANPGLTFHALASTVFFADSNPVLASGGATYESSVQPCSEMSAGVTSLEERRSPLNLYPRAAGTGYSRLCSSHPMFEVGWCPW